MVACGENTSRFITQINTNNIKKHNLNNGNDMAPEYCSMHTLTSSKKIEKLQEESRILFLHIQSATDSTFQEKNGDEISPSIFFWQRRIRQ